MSDTIHNHSLGGAATIELNCEHSILLLNWQPLKGYSHSLGRNDLNLKIDSILDLASSLSPGGSSGEELIGSWGYRFATTSNLCAICKYTFEWSKPNKKCQEDKKDEFDSIEEKVRVIVRWTAWITKVQHKNTLLGFCHDLNTQGFLKKISNKSRNTIYKLRKLMERQTDSLGKVIWFSETPASLEPNLLDAVQEEIARIWARQAACKEFQFSTLTLTLSKLRQFPASIYIGKQAPRNLRTVSFHIDKCGRISMINSTFTQLWFQLIPIINNVVDI